MHRWQERLYEILETAHPHDRLSRFFDLFLLALISLNVLAVIVETVDVVARTYGPLLFAFELFSVAVFTLGYGARIWTCTVHPRYRHPLWGRLRFMATPLALVDLLAIVPFYLPMFLTLDLRFIRILRFFRLLRFLKIGRYSESMQILGRVLHAKREELLTALFVAGVLLVLSSSLLYFVEHDAQPAVFSSIPAAMWWGVATLTTVGYGDAYPITPLGRFFGAVVAILGIGMFALPAGILASGFSEEMASRRQHDLRHCPHCGRPLSEAPTAAEDRADA